MTTKRVLRISSIMDFFKEEPKLVSRGENAMESNNVKDMQFDGQLLMIRGGVHASMRDRVYKVQLKLDKESEIVEASCTCPRGQLMCHHMTALALFAYHNVSVTDVSCSWSAKKNSGDEIKSIAELYETKGHQSISQSVSQEDIQAGIQELRSSLGIFKNAVGFTWLIRNEPKEFKQIPDIEEIVFSKEYLEEKNKNVYLENILKLSEDKIEAICKETVGQSSNETWLIARKNRLTSSNFGVVLAAIKRNKFPPSLFKRLTESYTLDGIKAIQWGKQHEADGRLVFEKNRNANVTLTGLWLDKCGFIGGSPDGLYKDSILEIKCPYKLRKTVSLLQDLRDKNYILFFNEKNEVELNKNHEYYNQIQGNLFLTKRKICFLVIWTPTESIIYDVPMDKEWANNIDLLKTFYFNCYILFLIGNKDTN